MRALVEKGGWRIAALPAKRGILWTRPLKLWISRLKTWGQPRQFGRN